VLITAMPLCAAVLQFLLSPLLLWRSFMSTALANAVYAAALCHYHYLNFLGYSALPSDGLGCCLIVDRGGHALQG
jgi:hypothetical protein